MATKEPLRYDVRPRAIDAGESWLTVTLENTSSKPLRGLEVSLHSLDEYSVEVMAGDAFVPILEPGAKETIPVQVSAKLPGSVYLTVEGQRGEDRFQWESPDITLTVGEQSAELVRLLALVEPKPAVGETVRCEATLRGQPHSEGLRLEFWAEAPGGELEELAVVETKELSPDEESRYMAQVEVEEEGRCTIYAYLYDGMTRLGWRVETLRVGEEQTGSA